MNSTSSIPPTQLGKTRPNLHREPDILSTSGKHFPVKVFQMLQDETITNYVSWRKHESLDALYIPDIEAFAVNVMPKYFKEMKGGWGSFQKQLNNYGFEKRDRGAGKALYTHSGNKFRKGRPDLLPKVLRRLCPKPTASAGRGSRPAQERPTAPIEPTTPQSESQIDPRAKEDQLEHEKKKLEREILELNRELERSEARRSEIENQFQTTENRLQATENLLLEIGNQLIGLLSTVNVAPAAASSFFPYRNNFSQSVFGESHPSMGIPSEILDHPSFNLAILQPDIGTQVMMIQPSS